MPLEKKTRAIIAGASLTWAVSLLATTIALVVIVRHNWHLIEATAIASRSAKHIKHDLPREEFERLHNRLTKVYNAMNMTALELNLESLRNGIKLKP